MNAYLRIVKLLFKNMLKFDKSKRATIVLTLVSLSILYLTVVLDLLLSLSFWV